MLDIRMKLLPGVRRYEGRDIVRVEMPGPPMSPSMKPLGHQPFYRSSGRHSGHPGIWMPFDGIVPLASPWFDKARFCTGIPREHRLYRFGTEDYKQASEMLAELTIEPAPETKDINAINRWLGLY